MSDRPPITLVPVTIGLDSHEFRAIAGWKFADAFVARLLRDDLPERLESGRCQVWSYRDGNDQLVGFGTLDLCRECAEYSAGRLHPYIPLLAVKPACEGRGYGRFIVNHLFAEAIILALQNLCAMALYEKLGFVRINAGRFPIPSKKA